MHILHVGKLGFRRSRGTRPDCVLLPKADSRDSLRPAPPRHSTTRQQHSCTYTLCQHTLSSEEIEARARQGGAGGVRAQAVCVCVVGGRRANKQKAREGRCVSECVCVFQCYVRPDGVSWRVFTNLFAKQYAIKSVGLDTNTNTHGFTLYLDFLLRSRSPASSLLLFEHAHHLLSLNFLLPARVAFTVAGLSFHLCCYSYHAHGYGAQV